MSENNITIEMTKIDWENVLLAISLVHKDVSDGTYDEDNCENEDYDKEAWADRLERIHHYIKNQF